MRSTVGKRAPPLGTEDYYWILGVPHNATDGDICKAYRKHAARWLPSKHPDNRKEAEMNFRHINEAFQVLANKMLRQLYDKFGREGLLPDDVGIDFDGMVQRPKVFPFREAMDVYREFFGGAKTPDLPTGPPVYDEHGFEHSFNGFPRPETEMPVPPPSQSGLSLYKGFMFSGPTEDDFKSVCITTKIVDGRNIHTNRSVSRGVETLTVKEDGVVQLKTVDGIPQPLY